MTKINLMQGNCLDLIQTIPDKSIDMILCDLPYGTTKNKWDSVIDMQALWGGYNRVIKENGVIALFCDGLFMANLMLSQPKIWRYNLIWKKQQGCDFLNANRKPLKAHEEIAIFYKKQPVYNKQYWYGEPYKKTISGRKSENYGDYHRTASESKDGKRNPLTVLEFRYDKNKLHPTQKPVALLEYLIRTFTDEGNMILDNCMGSGSTGIACINTNRNFIGMELDNEYFNIASKRIKEKLNEQKSA